MSILISAPIDIESGYGRKAREIVSPIARKYWDDTIISFLKWGQNVESDLVGTKYEFLLEKKVPTPMGNKPDLHIHVGLPTEFKAVGNKNILFTSGAEVDRISHEWILKINREIDAVVVPSNFILSTFKNTSYQDASGKELKIEKPIYLIPESFSDDLLDPMSNNEKKELDSILSTIPEKKWFLTYGQMTPQINIGDDRKNISTLIVEFLKEFRGNNGVALILKVNSLNFSNHTYYKLEQFIKRIVNEVALGDPTYPSVYLIEGFLSNPQLFSLMSHENVVAHISTTHGEGFGRFLLEASLSKKPIIVPKIGAFRDFIYGSSVEYMDVDFVDVPKRSLFRDVIVKGSRWVDMKEGEIRRSMSKVYKNSQNMDGTILAKKNFEDFNVSHLEEKVLDLIDKYYVKEFEVIIPEIPE